MPCYANLRHPVMSLILVLLLVSLVHAQSTATSPTSSASASIASGTSKWTYAGCYNETTGVNGTDGARALVGTMETYTNMTVAACLDFCGSDVYAGLEYSRYVALQYAEPLDSVGRMLTAYCRECWCSPYLSALSNKLDDSQCDLPCEGNNSELCGGALRLSLYQQSTSTKGAGIKTQKAEMGSLLALGIAIGVGLCML